MITLACFSNGLETELGAVKFLTIYFGSLIGGDLFSLVIHREHGDYSSVGASGAISGIIFASIALFPGMEISLLGVHLYIPAWAYGLLYVLISIYGIRSQSIIEKVGNLRVRWIIALASWSHSMMAGKLFE